MTEQIIALLWERLGVDYEGDERCGVVLQDFQIIELVNESSDPYSSFVISEAQISPYKDKLAGIWHTHPRGPANLSIDDYNAVSDLPHLIHAIITPGQVGLYGVVDGQVMNLIRRRLDVTR